MASLQAGEQWPDEHYRSEAMRWLSQHILRVAAGGGSSASSSGLQPENYDAIATGDDGLVNVSTSLNNVKSIENQKRKYDICVSLMGHWSKKLIAAKRAVVEARRIETAERVRKYCESVADLNHNDFDSPQIAAEERAAE